MDKWFVRKMDRAADADRKAALCSCVTANWLRLLISSLLSGQEETLGEIKEELLINVNVIICLRRINRGTFCFNAPCPRASLAYVAKDLSPPRELHLVQPVATTEVCSRAGVSYVRGTAGPCSPLHPDKCRPWQEAWRKSWVLACVPDLLPAPLSLC